MVRDSFYVGVTTNSWLKLASEGYRHHYWGFGAALLMSSSPDMTGGVLDVKKASRFMQGRDTVWNFSSRGSSDCFLFPILTPNPDDTSHAAVEQADPASRLVAVAPNPASGKVKVACGAGMTLVEVFDNAGRKVHEQKATGMVVHFDVTGWPKGLYAVVVHSAVGSITKKLLVE